MRAVIRVAAGILLVLGVAAGVRAQCSGARARDVSGDGRADDTAALQSAIRAAIRSNSLGGTVCLPAGDYRITRTLVISDVLGIRLIGEGGATRLIWAGDDRSPMLLLSSVHDGEFRGFQIIATDAHPLNVGIQSITAADARLASKHNMFVDLRLDGTTGGIRKGFQIGGGGVDHDNDFHIFENVTVANYRDVAYSLENTQVYALLFVNCLFVGGPSSGIGLATDRSSATGGSFSWTGGGGGNNRIADFSLGSPNSGTIAITHAIFESSARFLKTGGPSGASFLVDVDGIRWSGDRLAADGVAIDFRSPGPLSIRNSRIGEDSKKALKISWTPGGSADAGVFVFEANVVKRAPGIPLFPGRQPTRNSDNWLQ